MKQSIAALVIQLSGKKRGIDFAPMTYFQQGMHALLTACFKRFNKNPLVLDIRYTQDEILFICDAKNKGNCLKILQLTEILDALINEVNKIGEAEHWNFSFVPHYAIDRGTSEILPFRQPARFMTLPLWTGDTPARARRLAAIIAKDNLPRRLITHDFYEALPEEIRKQFSIPYYRLHICCYGERVET